jgi:hypothetical protein
MVRKFRETDPLNDALNSLGALVAVGTEDAGDIQQAILCIVRIRSRRASGAKGPKMRRDGKLVPVDETPTQSHVSPLPTTNPFYGMGMREAAAYQLKLVPPKQAQTPKEIWDALSLAGFVTAHSDPVNAVYTALRRRAKIHSDVLLVGNGKWGRKDWYTEADLEEIQKSVGGMGGRDAADHSERTRAGLRVAMIQRGVKLGAPAVMTPEKLEETKRLVMAGVSVTEIAKRFGVTPQAIYHKYDRETLKALRKQGRAARSDDDEATTQERVVN